MVKKHLLAVLSTAGLLFAAAPLPASAEPAAPTCYGASCVDRLPEEAGCTDPATTTTRDSFVAANGRIIELRYSSACNAAWSRASGVGDLAGTCNGWTDNNLVKIQGVDWQGPGTQLRPSP